MSNPFNIDVPERITDWLQACVELLDEDHQKARDMLHGAIIITGIVHTHTEERMPDPGAICQRGVDILDAYVADNFRTRWDKFKAVYLRVTGLAHEMVTKLFRGAAHE